MVFFLSYILVYVEEICDIVGVIVKGKFIREGSLEEIKCEFFEKVGYMIILEMSKFVDWSSVFWCVLFFGENKYRIVVERDIREEFYDYVVK